jgi:putative salt-induced outer membrane protein YdiY
MDAERIRFPNLGVILSLALLWISSPAQGAAGKSDIPLPHPASTNLVLVTNVVVVTVTNYIVTTNAVISTNELPTEAKKKKSKKAATSAPPPDLNWVPPADDSDWIQLKSGEWLRGRIKAMQERELEFYSNELKDLSFDWKDIRQLRSVRTLDVLFVDGEKLSGAVMITPDQVVVTGAESRVHSRDELQSLTPGGSKEWNYWSGKLSLGLTLRSGNTESVEYNAQAHLERRTPSTRLSVDYIGNFSSFDGVENANNNRVNSEFDLWLSRRFYLILPFAEYYKDPFQNLEHRLTVGAGVGYDLIDRPNLNWNITAGPAFQKAWFESAQPGEPTEKGTGALVFGSRFDWDITHRIELILEYRGQFTSKEVGETTQHSTATLSLELTKRFDLDVSLVWDRIANPKVGSDGVQPKQDDFRLVVGLGVDF